MGGKKDEMRSLDEGKAFMKGISAFTRVMGELSSALCLPCEDTMGKQQLATWKRGLPMNLNILTLISTPEL